MSLPESIPQISLGTAALLIFGAIASLAMLRGLLRILWGTIFLCASGFAAFFSWQHAPALGRQFLGKESALLSAALPLVVFLLTFFLLRYLARSVVRPLGEPNPDNAEKNRRSPIRWAVTLLLSLIPTALLWFAGATFLRHAGSVAEIRTYAESFDTAVTPDRTAFLAKLKENIEQALPADWFSSIDPLADEARVALAKLISAAESAPPKAIPVLEEPDIRDIVLSDPELRQLAREGRYSEILRDPRLDRMLENDNLREVLANTKL
ncbi:hypothetical protein HAHE_35230 [Haloferula helveola]|uniref:CvpA family protein n=1 Tax=Haloferula helveola TaxID=490095 RepID=A0ABM7RJA1_9BACT|nr:hypothetical protein HAHE_35230 [Haloferula helveola]